MQQKKPYVTRVYNSHASVTLLGVVVDSQADEIHYLSAIGPKGSLQSIWASLASRSQGRVDVSSKYAYSNDGKLLGPAFDSYWRLKGASGMKAFWSPLPNTAWSHMVAVSGDVRDNKVIVVTDPEAVYWAGKERKARITAAMPEFTRRFVAALNTHSDAPVLEEWGEALLQSAIINRWVRSLTAQGDALIAGRVFFSLPNILGAIRQHLGVGGEVVQ